MKYKVFKVEENGADYRKEMAKMSGTERIIANSVLEVVLDHQSTANERHNEAMLEKDIVIAGLEAKIAVYERILSERTGQDEG